MVLLLASLARCEITTEHDLRVALRILRRVTCGPGPPIELTRPLWITGHDVIVNGCRLHYTGPGGAAVWLWGRDVAFMGSIVEGGSVVVHGKTILVGYNLIRQTPIPISGFGLDDVHIVGNLLIPETDGIGLDLIGRRHSVRHFRIEENEIFVPSTGADSRQEPER